MPAHVMLRLEWYSKNGEDICREIVRKVSGIAGAKLDLYRKKKRHGYLLYVEMGGQRGVQHQIETLMHWAGLSFRRRWPSLRVELSVAFLAVDGKVKMRLTPKMMQSLAQLDFDLEIVAFSLNQAKEFREHPARRSAGKHPTKGHT